MTRLILVGREGMLARAINCCAGWFLSGTSYLCMVGFLPELLPGYF